MNSICSAIFLKESEINWHTNCYQQLTSGLNVLIRTSSMVCCKGQ